MSCGRANTLDLAEFVVDPAKPEWADFKLHYPSCADCSDEVAVWMEIEGALSDAAEAGGGHPEPALLQTFHFNPGSIEASRKLEVESHLASCRSCADEMVVLREFDFSALEAVHATAPEGALAAAGRFVRSLFSRSSRRFSWPRRWALQSAAPPWSTATARSTASGMPSPIGLAIPGWSPRRSRCWSMPTPRPPW